MHWACHCRCSILLHFLLCCTSASSAHKHNCESSQFYYSHNNAIKFLQIIKVIAYHKYHQPCLHVQNFFNPIKILSDQRIIFTTKVIQSRCSYTCMKRLIRINHFDLRSCLIFWKQQKKKKLNVRLCYKQTPLLLHAFRYFSSAPPLTACQSLIFFHSCSCNLSDCLSFF